MDTMSMHIACSGFSHDQRNMYITNDKSDIPDSSFTRANFWRKTNPVCRLYIKDNFNFKIFIKYICLFRAIYGEITVH